MWQGSNYQQVGLVEPHLLKIVEGGAVVSSMVRKIKNRASSDVIKVLTPISSTAEPLLRAFRRWPEHPE